MSWVYYLYLQSIEIDTNMIRFLKHMKDDCWEAKIEISYGCIELVGIADRSYYDLTQQSKLARTAMVASRKLNHVIKVDVIEVKPRKTLWKNCRDKLAAISGYPEGFSKEEKEVLTADIRAK